MKPVLDLIMSHWLVIAVGMSLFWGIRGAYLEYVDRTDDFILRVDKPHRLHSLLNFATFQFIFSFVGSFAGWCCLYILILRVQPNLLRNLDSSDFVLFLLSFLGIAGILSQAIYGLIKSLGKIAAIGIDKLVK